MKHVENHLFESEIVHSTKDGDATCEDEVAKLEDISKNKSRDSTFITYFRSGANHYVLTLILTLFILSQVLASGCDYWVAFW